MSEIVLHAEVRKEIGKSAHKIRYQGKIPGVYYSNGDANINIATTPLALNPLVYTSHTHVVNLKLDSGETKTCILRDLQFDPVTDKVVHFDLQGLKENEELTLDVPVVTIGTPKGIKDGGILQHILHKLKVSCLPKHIPEHIELNVADLAINQSIHVRDIKIDNVKILDNQSSSVVGVIPPTVEKVETPAADVTAAITATAEPEVITKGKKPVEGEVPAAAAPAKK